MQAQYIKTIELNAKNKFKPAELLYEEDVPIEHASIIGFISDVHENSVDTVLFEPIDMELNERTKVSIILSEELSWDTILSKLIGALKQNPEMHDVWVSTFDLPDLL